MDVHFLTSELIVLIYKCLYMKIKNKIILTSLMLCFFMTTLSVTLNAQSPVKSQTITEYNGKQYYLHTVERRQSLEEIALIYDVSVDEIMAENKGLRKKPRKGTVIRIPYIEIIEEVIDIEADTLSDIGIDTLQQFYPMNYDSERLYKVALMVPLYLENVDEEFLNEEISNKLLLNKSFSYLHFYEGFMIAVDSMISKFDLKLDLKVYDIDMDTAKLSNALNDSWLSTVDMIVGPFHLKPFERMLDYASHHNIMIVNPMTYREDLLVNKHNMVKVKPSYSYQFPFLEKLIREEYYDNNIFVLADVNYDRRFIDTIVNIAKRNVKEYSLVPNSLIKNVISKQYEAWTHEEIEFSDSIYHSDNMNFDLNYFRLFPDDSTNLKNHVIAYDYARDSLNGVKKMASAFRNNLFIACGDSRVFASEIVNKLNMLTEKYPVNLIALPDWSKFDRLFNENLMNMGTVYFDEDYVDYGTFAVGKFVCKFRDEYGTEPTDMAFHGFNIGWYFLNALMCYGDNTIDAITTYKLPLLNTKYSFERKSFHDGAENIYWNIYRYNGKKYDKELLRYE